MAFKPLLPENVKYLVVHCSATPANRDIGVKELDRMHRERGFLKIGYHYVIRRDGSVELGRSIKEPGAHVEGYNGVSIGVCLVGGVTSTLKPEDNFEPAQKDALRTLLYQLVVLFPDAKVQGHRDFPDVAKACPSFDVKSWWKQNRS
jgi:N-acetylmuramoyl-L-alanine amidase